MEGGEAPVRIALDRKDRVDHEAGFHPLFGKLAHHRIDQKRHIVIDDFDDRMRRRPAIRGLVRVVHAQLGLTQSASLTNPPQRQRGRI